VTSKPRTAQPPGSRPGPLLFCTAAQAISRIDERVIPLPPERIPARESVGRRLAGPAIAAASVPGFRRAAMDGFAIRSEDSRAIDAGGGEISLMIAGESLPGSPFPGVVGPGRCAAIATGAVVPDGADAIVRWEAADRRGDAVTIRRPVESGKDIALPGEDIRAGEVIVAPPRTLRPQDAAACCSAGILELDVAKAPRVAILATGDELVSPGEVPGFGRIVDTNSLLLRSLVGRDGGSIIRPEEGGSGILPDRPDAIRSALAGLAEQADCLLISGGTSHGRGDHAVAALEALGTIEFRGVEIRPAAPVAFGMIGRVPVVLLPGNPVACLFAYDLFARRIIRTLGARDTDWPYRRRVLKLGQPIRSPLGVLEYVRVRLSGADGSIEPVRPRGASILSSAVRADGFILVPEDSDGFPAGHPASVYMYDSEPN
jgi:molybdopterin molybdotransferase